METLSAEKRVNFPEENCHQMGSFTGIVGFPIAEAGERFSYCGCSFLGDNSHICNEIGI